MKLILPHREVRLSSDIDYDERNTLIKEILEELVEFHDENMTIEEYFRYTWDKQNTRTSLDIIGYYLTKGNFEGEDREILSHKKQKELKKGSKRHITFSGMSVIQQEDLGIIDIGDSNYS